MVSVRFFFWGGKRFYWLKQPGDACIVCVSPFPVSINIVWLSGRRCMYYLYTTVTQIINSNYSICNNNSYATPIEEIL